MKINSGFKFGLYSFGMVFSGLISMGMAFIGINQVCVSIFQILVVIFIVMTLYKNYAN